MKKKQKNLVKKVVIGISVLLLLLVLIVSVKGLEFQTPEWNSVDYGVFSNHLLFSIFGGSKIVSPGQQLNFSVFVPAIGDYEGDYSKGVLTVRYGNWAVIDKDNKIVSQGDWENVRTNYSKNISFVAPDKMGDYALVAVVVESKGVFENGSWEWSNETLNNKEAFKFSVVAPKPSVVPKPTSIVSWLSDVWSWIKSLFGI